MLNKIYTYWCLVVGALLYVLWFPVQFVFLQFKRTHAWADRINFLVLKFMFKMWTIKTNIEGKEHISKKKNYVLVGNHASYLDIPMMFFVNKGYGIFVGKSSLRKIPLFGYMYKKLYIMVDRRDGDSRNRVFELGKKALEENRNLIIFPEGTIPNKNLPQMLPFKEGAFRIAIETKTPIVPISIINNWKIMSDSKPLRIKKHSFAAKIHEPIDTSNLTLEDVHELRNRVFKIIEEELINQNLKSNENK